jgi:hypothetical protein
VAVHGDPKILQLVNIVHFNTKALSNVVKFLTRIQATKVSLVNINMNRSNVFSNLQLIQKQLPLLKAFVPVYTKLKQEALAEAPNRPDLKKFSDVYIGIADELYGTFVAKVEEWVTNTAALNKDTANKVELQTAVTALAGFLPNGNNVLMSIFNKTEVPPEEHDQGKDLAILERSTAMHQAGTAGKASKGVWKVGNQHVKDIQDTVSKDVQPAYELMTEDEFIENFDKWLAQNQDYQNMKNMENQV